MTNEIRAKALEVAAGFYANWKACLAALEYDEERDYRNKYDGARQMAAIMGIEESEIEEMAWRLYGNEIGMLYDENNATW